MRSITTVASLTSGSCMSPCAHAEAYASNSPQRLRMSCPCGAGPQIRDARRAAIAELSAAVTGHRGPPRRCQRVSSK
eukprot:1207588-Lingulodinium_polyedra.AAC.1